MARRGRGQLSTQLGISNANHLPPPSTIAAQIVHNHIRSNNVARQEPENDALFGQLLQEYLRNPMAEEATVETNAQLISVVVEAGLNVLAKDNPFAPDTLAHQAKDSLTVISYTIEKIPGVLFFTGIGNEGDNLPLFLWLLPKILNLLGRRHTAMVQKDLCNILTISIRSLQKTTQLWRNAAGLQDIITAVVEGEFNSSLRIWSNRAKHMQTSYRLSKPTHCSIVMGHQNLAFHCRRLEVCLHFGQRL